MKTRIFNVPFDSRTGFDDRALRSFCDEYEIISVSDHFFQLGAEPMLSLVVCYSGKQPKRDKQKLISQLDPTQRALFDALRGWRSVRAAADGIPVYLVARNEQLAHLARLAPQKKSQLREVPGLGDKKVKAYGDEIIATIERTLAGAQRQDKEPSATEPSADKKTHSADSGSENRDGPKEGR